MHLIRQVRPQIFLKSWQQNHASVMTDTIQKNAVHIRQWLPWPAEHYALSDAEHYLHQCHIAEREKGILSLGIWEDGRLIGGISMNHVDALNHSTHLGYWLVQEATGRGIMTDTTRYMVNELFSLHEFHRIVIAAHPENIRSRHIAERLHFCQEGVLRDVVLHQGQYIDWVIYSLLQTEWLLLP